MMHRCLTQTLRQYKYTEQVQIVRFLCRPYVYNIYLTTARIYLLMETFILFIITA